MIRLSKPKKKYSSFVEPDEIFIDAKNLPKFDTQQFQGRLERPIAKTSIRFLGVFFVLMIVLFGVRLSILQIKNGHAFFEKSQNNRLDREPFFADRGIIYDRNDVLLAWNEANVNGDIFTHRSYIDQPGFSNLLGYVSYPSKDSNGFYWQSEFVGKDGLEKEYNDILNGQNGVRLTERDARGNILSQNIVNPPIAGSNLTLSIDSRVQEELYKNMKTVVQEANYQGGAGAIMDINTGELVALATYPEYSSAILSSGDDSKTINNYFQNKNKPFLNRPISGLYSPGSIIKPIIGLAALKEGVIDAKTKILAAGSISVPNPYAPGTETVFKDYNPNNGWIDLAHALSVSSNIYFYEVGGGYQSQKGIGIDNIGKYARLFGLGGVSGIDLPNEQEGTIPSPEWKAEMFNGDPWRIGDTYHTAIGQYGVQVTPIQMLRVVSAVASDGKLVTPHVVKNSPIVSMQPVDLPFTKDQFEAIHEGMRLSALSGTGHTLGTLSFKVATKTGTAQVGIHNEFINSWTMGFFPYDNPRYAFVVMMERGPVTNTIGSQLAARGTLDWMSVYTPEYTNPKE